jgi:hypothetical protein
VVATRMLHILQRNDDTRYETEDGETFVLAQVPAGAVQVSAHSSSPVYAEQVAQKAFALHKVGAITTERLVELVDPPMVEALKADARELDKRKAEAGERQFKLAEAKAMRPARR